MLPWDSGCERLICGIFSPCAAGCPEKTSWRPSLSMTLSSRRRCSLWGSPGFGQDAQPRLEAMRNKYKLPTVPSAVFGEPPWTASAARVIPVVIIAFRVAALGICTVSLLEALTGCFCAIFGYRRLMSLMDCVYRMTSRRPLPAGACSRRALVVVVASTSCCHRPPSTAFAFYVHD